MFELAARLIGVYKVNQMVSLVHSVVRFIFANRHRRPRVLRWKIRIMSNGTGSSSNNRSNNRSSTSHERCLTSAYLGVCLLGWGRVSRMVCLILMELGYMDWLGPRITIWGRGVIATL